MTAAEWRAFLTTPVRTAKLATVRADGRPHVAPIWIALDDDDTVVFMTGAGTVKGRNILGEPRVALCVDDDQPPFAFVVIEGSAEVSEDPVALFTWATRIGGRYMGEDRAEEYGRRNAVAGELLVRVRPTRVIAQKDVAD
ncbi:MAG: PPOX class F420-dependent oxidoreductase [Actinomycetota bacterium]|nr:PPOX class F420-dependent oxidoreductase [Actinomycetota bacterium]